MDADRSRSSPRGLAAYAAIAAGGIALAWWSGVHPASLPFWAPWEFSWPVYLTTALCLYWFVRGLRDIAVPRWRRTCFVLGVAVIYAVLQTRFEYMSQHMFFLNRVQHVVMHHLGPFLIGLGTPGAAIAAGMPARLRRLLGTRPVTVVMRVVQQPAVAAFLFVGLIYLWLVPPVHFTAMIDPDLYALMNFSMVVDGILFWSLVLDPRPCPPARTSFGVRVALAAGVMFPQIVLGAAIALTGRDLYSFYDLCGRLFPSVPPLTDQHIGGIIIWIPPSMMSVVAVILVLNALRLTETPADGDDADATQPFSARSSLATQR